MAKKVVYKDRYVLATGCVANGSVDGKKFSILSSYTNPAFNIKAFVEIKKGGRIGREFREGEELPPLYRLVLECVKREAQ